VRKKGRKIKSTSGAGKASEEQRTSCLPPTKGLKRVLWKKSWKSRVAYVEAVVEEAQSVPRKPSSQGVEAVVNDVTFDMYYNRDSGSRESENGNRIERLFLVVAYEYKRPTNRTISKRTMSEIEDG
jgi:hypothetical protein